MGNRVPAVAHYSGDYKQGYNSSGDYWSCETASKAAGTIEDVIYATTPHNLPQDFTQDVIDFYYARQEIAEKYAVADCLYAEYFRVSADISYSVQGST